MDRKLLIPVGVVVLAGVIGLIIFLTMGDRAPAPTPDNKDPDVAEKPTPPVNRTPPERPVSDVPLNIAPDPVTVSRPERFMVEKDLPRIIVSGRVVDGNGIGVADAEVVFTGDRSIRGTHGTGYTDGGGNYRFLAWSQRVRTRSPSPDRTAAVAARAPDGGTGVARSESVAESDTIMMPDIVISAGGSIEGRVESSNGAPATGAPITVQSQGALPMADLRGREPRIEDRRIIQRVQADDRGAYSVKNLPAGKYRITGDPGYFGMNTDAQIVEVAEGRVTTANVVLRLDNYVRGQVVDSVGQPVPGAVVEISGEGISPEIGKPLIDNPLRGERVGLRRANDDDNSSLRRFAEETTGHGRQMTDAEGRFGFFNLADKPWTITARVGKAEAKFENAPVNQADVTLRVDGTGGRLVSGAIVDAETGLAVTAFDVRVVKEEPNDPDPFTRVLGDRVFPWRSGGTFRVVNPPEGDFHVRISAPGYVPLSIPVSALGASEHRAGVEGRMVPLCDLRLTPTVEGRSMDFEPVVLLFGERQIAYRGATDAVGQMRITDVTPGAYEVKLLLPDGSTLDAKLTVPPKRRADLTLALSLAG